LLSGLIIPFGLLFETYHGLGEHHFEIFSTIGVRLRYDACHVKRSIVAVAGATAEG
jgi:hypothetical protein